MGYCKTPKQAVRPFVGRLNTNCGLISAYTQFSRRAVGYWFSSLKSAYFRLVCLLFLLLLTVSQNSVSRRKRIFPNPRPVGIQQIGGVTGNVRFELNLLLFSHQSNFHLHCDFFDNPASSYTYYSLYRPIILFHESKFYPEKSYFNRTIMSLPVINRSIRHWANPIK